MSKSGKLLALLILAFAGVAATYFFELDRGVLLKHTAYLLFPILVALGGIYAVKVYGFGSAGGRALLWIAAGFGAWTIGELVWYWFKDYVGIDPFPSVADVFYLLGYPLIFVGLIKEIRLLKIKLSQLGRPTLSLGLGVVFLLALIVGYFGVYRAYNPAAALSENLIGMSYGVADLLLIVALLFMFVAVWVFKGGKLASFWSLMLFGIVSFLVADLLFVVYSEPYINDVKPFIYLDLLWTFGDLLCTYGFFSLGFSILGAQEKLKAATADK